MKLDKVILSSDDNPDYLEFWPIVSEAWRNIGIEPILFYTGKNKIKNENVFNFNLEKRDSAFLAQNIRLLAPTLFPNDTCIISDIDNMPLSEDYFQGNIVNIADNQFIIYRPDATSEDMISIMWNAAKGSKWIDIFEVDSVESITKKLLSWYPENYSIGGDNWYHDQKILKEYITKYEAKNISSITRLNDESAGFCRLNRSNYSIFFKKFYDHNKKYSDFHMPRPYSKYHKLINKVFNLNF